MLQRSQRFGRLGLVPLILLLFLLSCQSQTSPENLSSPDGYDLNKPFVLKLPSYLDEISGLAYYPKDKSTFAINDEEGWLYKVYLHDKMPIQKWKYAPGDDFEDLVLYDSTFYILQSTGKIIAARFVSTDSVEVEEYDLGLAGENEFEILYLEEKKNRLILICKDCERDNKSTLSSFAFDLNTKSFVKDPAFVIDVTKIAAMMNETKVKFKPSAAAIHPITGQLYIISSINKIVVVANPEGVPEKIHNIDPKLYKQPEGLAFTPEGHLLISNESADIGAANILIYKYNKG